MVYNIIMMIQLLFFMKEYICISGMSLLKKNMRNYYYVVLLESTFSYLYIRRIIIYNIILYIYVRIY